jgi:hypothetical protein
MAKRDTLESWSQICLDSLDELLAAASTVSPADDSAAA